MTEDEAKTKACFQAVTFGGSQQLNAGAGPFCIGSACMAWREKPPLWEHRSPLGPYTDKRETDGYGQKGKPLPVDGFCGLAGQPS